MLCNASLKIVPSHKVFVELAYLQLEARLIRKTSYNITYLLKKLRRHVVHLMKQYHSYIYNNNLSGYSGENPIQAS